MTATLPTQPGHAGRLAIYTLLSAALHLAILSFVRPTPVTRLAGFDQPMAVYLLARPSGERVAPPQNSKVETFRHRRGKSTFITEPLHTPMATGNKQEDPPAPSKPLVTQAFMNSARSIARDEARVTEQQLAELERKRRSTPVALLEQYLRMPHEELRLSSGILKITTRYGSICYRPVPSFARDAAAVFGLPTTCL